jgi:uncharacterized protein YyaL (SSP411 family)
MNAYLDDHAFLLAALIELLQTAFRAEDLSWAIEIADALLARFEDRAGGGFFSPATTTKACCCARSPDTTMPHRPATASPRRRWSRSATGCRTALPGQRRAPVRAFGRELAARPVGFHRC